MERTIGGQVEMQRRRHGWSQDRLASEAGIDRRTIQRIEAGDTRPSSATVEKLARALGVDIMELEFGLSEAALADLKDQYLCPSCGSTMEYRTSVDHEYGDVEFEVFACGHTRGWQYRPCPKDPSFPKLEDYDIQVLDVGKGEFESIAIGRTDASRSVDLAGGTGRTAEAAERWVRRSYIQARDGSAAAETAYPLFG